VFPWVRLGAYLNHGDFAGLAEFVGYAQLEGSAVDQFRPGAARPRPAAPEPRVTPEEQTAYLYALRDREEAGERMKQATGPYESLSGADRKWRTIFAAKA